MKLKTFLLLERLKSYYSAEIHAVLDGRGMIRNGRYWNIGQTYELNGRLRFDFDLSNSRDPNFKDVGDDITANDFR